MTLTNQWGLQQKSRTLCDAPSAYTGEGGGPERAPRVRLLHLRVEGACLLSDPELLPQREKIFTLVFKYTFETPYVK